MESEVFERIRDYLADQLDIEAEKITPESDIINDFGADSLDVIDMITTLSDEFGVEIPGRGDRKFPHRGRCGCLCGRAYAVMRHGSMQFCKKV